MNKKWIIILWFVLLPLSGLAQAPIPQPVPGSFVHDFANVITADKKAEIQAKAQQLKANFNTEIAVVTIDSLQGEDGFDYSMRMAREWGIGSKDNDMRGLLILVAVKDRKTAFRTSRHIEDELPDGVTGDINRQMNNYFKQGDFGGGLSAGMDIVLDRLKSMHEPGANPSHAKSGLGYWWFLIIGGPFAIIGLGLALLAKMIRRSVARQEQRERAANVNRANYFAADAKLSATPPAPKSKRRKDKSRKSTTSLSPSYGSITASAYEPSSSSSYDSGSSSGYDSGSSSSSNSGSSYSGGSDFGGGGSDSSW